MSKARKSVYNEDKNKKGFCTINPDRRETEKPHLKPLSKPWARNDGFLGEIGATNESRLFLGRLDTGKCLPSILERKKLKGLM